MTRIKRRFAPEEKHSILQKAEREGYTEVCRKCNVASSALSYWKEKYLSKGKVGLKAGYTSIDPQIRELEEEKEQLKKIVSKQALEIEFKTELIKKNQVHLLKGRK